jgi:hypothetical protein
MKEPSVLDYLKSRLNPWQKEKIQFPVETGEGVEPAGEGDEAVSVEYAGAEAGAPLILATHAEGGEDQLRGWRASGPLPWRTVLALLAALAAQMALEPSIKAVPVALGLYLGAFVFLGWAYLVNEFGLPALPEAEDQTEDAFAYHPRLFIAALLLAMAAFVFFSNNLFTTFNVTLWLAALACFVGSLWLFHPGSASPLGKIIKFFQGDPWWVPISRGAVLLVVIAGLILFFRFYRLDGIPGEPFSDHAEKLLDVFDVTQGQTHIFFPRNTGREFIQFYWTAFLSGLLGTGISFLTLKIGTALIGFLTLPYVYLLGREVGGKRVALFALILAGTSYWLNTISRIGLRFPLYPAFAAPVLYYLIRGLRRQSRNDFILAGLFLGLGLHGYSPFRFVPFVVVLAVGLYLLHQPAVDKRRQTLVLFAMLVLASFLVFLPLLRYAIENPEMFSYRALTRLTGQENPLPAPAWQIFVSNTFNAMTMFNYDNGEIWVHSVPHRPALDVVSAVLFAFGYLFVLIRYLRKRDWRDLFLFLAVPMLLMPSILSLAFPAENPSLNRTGAAGVVVFVIAGMALEGLYLGLRGLRKSPARQGVALSVVVFLLLVSSLQNYTLVFNQFADQFMLGAWNTSEMGDVIRAFVAEGNNPENAFVIPYPYWVDTRLVGIQAGYPNKDYAINRADLPRTLPIPGSKLFIVKEDDQETLKTLRDLYPSALVGLHLNPLEGKNFWIYTVPDNQTIIP